MAQPPPGSFPGELFAYFGLACAVTGAATAITLYIGSEWLQWWNARQWTATECTFVRTDPTHVYRYTAAGTAHESDRIGIGDWQSVYQLGIPQINERRPCFYDPAAPSHSVLTRDYDGWWYIPGVWILSAFMLLTTAPQLAIALWRWATFRPDPPLTWSQWLGTFYENGAWSMTLVGLAALLPGVVMIIFFTALPWWNWWQAQHWPEVQCEMTRAEVRGWNAGTGRQATGGYIIDIAYRYHYNGIPHTASNYSPWRLGGTEWLLQSTHVDEIEAMLKKFAPGTRHTCYVSPRAPSSAYLSRDRSNFGTYVSAIGPFLTLLGWIVICSRR